MVEKRSLFIEYFGNYPLIRVLDFLIENRIFDYSKKDIAKYSNVSYNTFKTFFNKLVKLGLVIKTRKVGKSDMYQLNKESPIVQSLLQIDKFLMLQIIKKVDEEELKKPVPA